MTTAINSQAELDQLVKDNDTVLVDFWATWCPPCRMMNPILEGISRDMLGKVTIAKIDVDKNQELSGKYNISSIPTMLVFKKGEKFGQEIIGAVPGKNLTEYLEKVIDYGK
jgi:thioredoxin 1